LRGNKQGQELRSNKKQEPEGNKKQRGRGKNNQMLHFEGVGTKNDG